MSFGFFTFNMNIKDMDTNTLTMLLFNNSGNYTPLLCYIFYNIIVPELKTLWEYIKYICRRRYNSICIQGSYKEDPLAESNNYPLAFLAICDYIQTHNICDTLVFFERNTNGASRWFNQAKQKEASLDYVVRQLEDIRLKPDVFINIKNTSRRLDNTNITDVHCTLYSYKLTCNHLTNVVEEILNDYMEKQREKSSNKTFHFLYKGVDDKNKPVFTHNIMSDFDKGIIVNETFDTMSSRHSNTFIRDLDRLKDKAYFVEKGLKRKKGYLLHGISGGGKTASVMAMSNYSRRHIIEVPISKITLNAQLEDIINLYEINGIRFNKEDVIILFDEIDQIYDTIKDRKLVDEASTKTDKASVLTEEEKSLVSIMTPTDKINLHTILSRLDGIGNYDGLVFVATTNYIENIDHALCRSGRLTPIMFDYISYSELQEMCQKMYGLLSRDQLDVLKRVKKVSHADIRVILEQYEDNLEGFIDYLRYKDFD